MTRNRRRPTSIPASPSIARFGTSPTASRQLLMFVLVMLLTMLAVPSRANAETSLLDWLFPLRAERQAARRARATQTYRPVTSTNAYTPGTPGYTGTNTTHYGGNFAGGDTFGSGGYYPSYGSWNGWGYQNNNASNYYATYRPTTVYRTQWQSVPVTSYSPVAGADYQTPATSYEWQALRVPYVAFQPTAPRTNGAANWQPAGSMPNTAGGCTCSTPTAATTAYYGSASGAAYGAYGSQATASVNDGGWQPVPAGTATSSATTARYAPRADYVGTDSSDGWQTVTHANRPTTTDPDTNWQPVMPEAHSATASSDSDSLREASQWRPVDEHNSASSPSDPTPANTAPRLESNTRRDTYYRDRIITQYERERDALAREREALQREREELMQERQRAAQDKQSALPPANAPRDRFSDWPNDRDGYGTHGPARRTGWENDYAFGDQNRNRADGTRPVTNYVPPFSSRPTVNTPTTRSNADGYQPMLDDGWNYDRANQSQPDSNRYRSSVPDDWRASAEPAPHEQRTPVIPANGTYQSPPPVSTATPVQRSVMPYLLRPIPETTRNTGQGLDRGAIPAAPKLLQPKDHTASRPTFSRRWQAIPATGATASYDQPTKGAAMAWRPITK